MNKAAFTIVALLITANGTFAQSGSLNFASNGEMSEADFVSTLYGFAADSSSGAAFISADASSAELTAAEVVAGNIRFIFNPTRALDSWPEYLYRYRDVTHSGLCNLGAEVGNHELGVSAILTDRAQSDQGTGTQNYGETIGFVQPSSLYAGAALNPAIWDSGNFVEFAPSYHVSDLCSVIQRIEESSGPLSGNEDAIFFATSRAIPEVDPSAFERVDLNLDMSSTSGNLP